MDINHSVESESHLPRVGADPTTLAPSERYPTPPLFGRLGQGANTHFCRSEQAQNQDRHQLQ